MRSFAFFLLVVCQAHAGEYVVLHNGFRLHADRHESQGATTRLHGSTGSVDVPTKDIASFEIEEYVAPKPAPPQAPAVDTTPPVSAQRTPQELLETAARKIGLRPEFVHSVAAAESAYNVHAVSPKGAIGLMQLMPATAKELGADPHNPAENAEAGARYLKQLLLKYQKASDPVRLALAAYNAGPGAVDRHGDIPPYRETQAYVERVLRRYLRELKGKS